MPSGLMEASYRLLRELSEAVNSSLLLDDIFDALGEVLREHLPYQEATIALLDDTLNGVKLLVRLLDDGTVECRTLHHRFVGDDPILRRLTHHMGVLTLSEKDPLAESLMMPPYLLGQVVSVLAIPLINKGVMTGALNLISSNPEAFTPHHHALLEEVAPPLAVAMENAKLFWQTQQQASREYLINHITKAIRQSLSLTTIGQAATDAIGRTTGVSRCILRVFSQPILNEFGDWKDNPPQTAHKVDVNVNLIKAKEVDVNVNLVSDETLIAYTVPSITPIPQDALLALDFERRLYNHRLRQGKQQGPHHHAHQSAVWNPFVLNDATDCPRFLNADEFLATYQVQSCLVVPIRRNDGACVGSLTLHQCEQPRVWLDEDLALFTALADHLGVALHQAHLYTSLAEQKNQLQHTLDELQQAQMHLIQSEKMAVIGQFVAGIAHDVNTPLGAMSSNQQTIGQCVEKIRTAVASNQPIEARWLDTMTQLLGVNTLASDRINDIVKNLRNFARLDSSDRQPVDIRDSWHSTQILLQRSLSDGNITLTVTVAEDVPMFMGYPGLLNQVWMNILVNAIQAVEGQTSPKITVAVTLDAAAQSVVVMLQDNGPGIPEAIRHRVFDPGFTTKGVGVGTGLGLALCYQMIAKHHGTIAVGEAEWADGHTGAKITVTLPIDET